MALRSPRTPCRACGTDCQDLDRSGICPDCTAAHAFSDDHAPACDCHDCQLRAAIDAASGTFFTPWTVVL